MMLGQTDKLIAQAAKKVLQPAGLFQKGESRIWIGDNGWFLIVVEFQLCSWTKGAYLNVGISFLWEQGKLLSNDLTYNIGYRQLSFEEYAGIDGAIMRKCWRCSNTQRNWQGYIEAT